jgi:hypothetical protein
MAVLMAVVQLAHLVEGAGHFAGAPMVPAHVTALHVLLLPARPLLGAGSMPNGWRRADQDAHSEDSRGCKNQGILFHRPSPFRSHRRQAFTNRAGPP